MTLRRNVSIALVAVLFLGTGYFYVRNRMLFSQGNATEKTHFVLERGKNALEVGKALQAEGLISHWIYFGAYLWKENKLHELKAGEYDIPPLLTIPEVAFLLTEEGGDKRQVRITFPEGWTMADMAKRLEENGFEGEEFLRIAKNPPAALLANYPLVKENLPEGSSLEGFLFPDTYLFLYGSPAEEVIARMLANFERKVSPDMIAEISAQEKKFFDVLVMASVIEGEVPREEDRYIVSGIFWKRLQVGMRLESDATLAYALGGERKKQHSVAETGADSPYNTYRAFGLPPGPINNPGISAIAAAIYPQKSEYFFFLSDTETGETIFSRTFEEHVANKGKYGL
ncbi:MAG TPA: endolytic transglycosylase MltG [Candidatus Moranbacteria bacterium]|nr:endolytic transglycosylase MltG [Candidatus Moranbacteria bacterium]